MRFYLKIIVVATLVKCFRYLSNNLRFCLVFRSLVKSFGGIVKSVGALYSLLELCEVCRGFVKSVGALYSLLGLICIYTFDKLLIAFGCIHMLICYFANCFYMRLRRDRRVAVESRSSRPTVVARDAMSVRSSVGCDEP